MIMIMMMAHQAIIPPTALDPGTNDWCQAIYALDVYSTTGSKTWFNLNFLLIFCSTDQV